MNLARSAVTRMKTLALIVSLSICLAATCPGGVGTSGVVSPLKLKLKADFHSDSAKGIVAAKVACPGAPVSEDEPVFNSGLDCDGDGGVVRYITPSTFKVAIKQLAFLTGDGQVYELIADSGTLAAAQVLDLTSPVTLELQPPSAGLYTTYLAEIYYYEITMPLYDANMPQTLRVYLSDDDFPAEGDLGHHQGDITLIGDDGTELGFVPAGQQWQVGQLTATRGNINGAGGTDAETGHLRGLFGDQTQWNQEAFAQGAAKDVFVLTGPLGLLIDTTRRTVTFSFDVTDTWFFEDFNNNQLFDPCASNPGDACNAGAAWAPIFNKPSVEVAVDQ